MSKAVEENELVWAKMRGYPHWPAKVMKPPKGTKPTAHKLFVFFYGTHEHAWLLESEVFPYEQFCDKFKKPSNRKGFMDGIRELEEELAKIRKRGAGKKTTSPGKQRPGEALSPQKHPSPITQHPSISSESSTSDTVTTSSNTNKGQSTALTVNQEASKNGGTDNSSSCDQSASMDVFFVSQDGKSTKCSQEEAPILIRKRKALRSLSHEPAKRTRSHDDPVGSLPLSESERHLSPPGGRVPSARATRSLTPHHYMIQHQQVGGIETLEEASDSVQQTVPENASKSATDVCSSVVPQMQKEEESKAGNEPNESVGEQMQTSSVPPGPEQTSSEDGLAYFLSMGEEDKTNMDTHVAEKDSEQFPIKEQDNAGKKGQSVAMDCTSQADAKHSPTALHKEEEKAMVEEQSGMETQVVSTSGTQQEKTSKPSKSETAKSTTVSEVTGPRRYSTRRQGIAQGSTVEKLTQSYTARLEQALGSPDAHKKKLPPLQSPKRTPKGAKASPKAPVKSGGGKSSRRSRGGTRGKAESEEGSEEQDKEDKEKGERGRGGGDDEGVIGGADLQALSEPSTPQVEEGKQDESAKEKEGAKNESKAEPGRRKSARLSSKMQQASTPTGGGDQRKIESSGKKQKEARSAGKKRSRLTSESSTDDGTDEVKVKVEAVDEIGQDTASNGGMVGETELQNETTTPVAKKQSKRGRKSQTATTASEEKSTKQSKASKPQVPNSGSRVLRTRQKDMAGSKGKSLPKKIKLEEPPGESLANDSQQQPSGSVETGEDTHPQEGSEETKQEEGSSEGKRVLRKRKQTSSATASAGSGSKKAAISKNNTSENTSSESVSKSTPTRQSKRLKVASKAESEPADKTDEPTTEEGSEELIIRVPTSVTKVNGALANGESTSEATSDKTEMPNDKELMATSDTPKDSSDVSGGQIGDSGEQSGSTGGQEEAPPTTHPPDQSSSNADPQPSSSNAQSSSNTTTAGGDEGDKMAGGEDKVELPKKIDSSELPPMIKIRAGMSTVEVLQAYNYNIKASLVIDAPNISKALTTLHDLKELQFSATDLEKVPDLVYTVRKLKHYHASSKVIRRAEEVYGKLKGLYMYPKMVPRPLKKKAVGGVGIRKRPPTMAEYLNNQTKKQKPSQLSRSQTHSKSKPSTNSTTSETSNRTKSQSPAPPPSLAPPPALAPEVEASGISDVISKRPTSDEIKAAHAPVVPQLTSEGIEQTTEDKEQPNQQLAEETDNIPQSRDVPTASAKAEGSSTSTGAPPNGSSSNIPARDTVQASSDSTVTATEQNNVPLQADLVEVANTETKESSARSQTESDSLTAGVSCPDVGRSSKNLLQSETKSQEANLLQTGHSLAADASSSSVGEPQSGEKSQEAKEGGDNDQIVPSS